MSEAKQEEKPSDSCEIDNFKKIVEGGEIVVVAITREGCEACDFHMPRLPVELPAQVSIVEVPTEKGDIKCDSLADTLKVEATPSLIAYYKGKQLNATPIVQMDPEKDEDPIAALKRVYKEAGVDLDALPKKEA